jgi:hypothetical protein
MIFKVYSFKNHVKILKPNTMRYYQSYNENKGTHNITNMTKQKYFYEHKKKYILSSIRNTNKKQSLHKYKIYTNLLFRNDSHIRIASVTTITTSSSSCNDGPFKYILNNWSILSFDNKLRRQEYIYFYPSITHPLSILPIYDDDTRNIFNPLSGFNVSLNDAWLS